FSSYLCGKFFPTRLHPSTSESWGGSHCGQGHSLIPPEADKSAEDPKILKPQSLIPLPDQDNPEP
ncbi:MAG: hypothetical protein Q7J98_06300, partial [Kiritimatiellia bacterium]|nr:hypothetical protein [Kiritimatiellia bacterium]